jgi:hypothetical protein
LKASHAVINIICHKNHARVSINNKTQGMHPVLALYPEHHYPPTFLDIKTPIEPNSTELLSVKILFVRFGQQNEF